MSRQDPFYRLEAELKKALHKNLCILSDPRPAPVSIWDMILEED